VTEASVQCCLYDTPEQTARSFTSVLVFEADGRLDHDADTIERSVKTLLEAVWGRREK
jgi:hypothetical protein